MEDQSIKLTDISKLCIDEISNIFEYFDYRDISKLYSVSKYWKSIVEEVTTYTDYINILNENINKIHHTEGEKLFYYCCQNNFVEVARKIYQFYEIDIFILRDVFYLNLCESSLDTIQRIFEIIGVDFSNYSFLSNEEEYEKIKKIISEINVSIMNTDTGYEYDDKSEEFMEKYVLYFENYCKQNEKTLQKLEILCLFGVTDELPLYSGFYECCKTGNIEEAKYLNKLVNVSSVLNASLTISAINNHLDVFKWLMTFKDVEKEWLIEIFISCCRFSALDAAKYIFNFDIISSNNDILKVSFYKCCSGGNENFETILWLKSKVQLCPKMINLCFVKACNADNYMAIQLLHSSGQVRYKVLGRCLFNAIKNNLFNTFRFIVVFGELKNRKRILNDCLVYACKNVCHDIVKYLLGTSNFDSTTMSKALKVCSITFDMKITELLCCSGKIDIQDFQNKNKEYLDSCRLFSLNLNFYKVKILIDSYKEQE
jgi:hypothetical protein